MVLVYLKFSAKWFLIQGNYDTLNIRFMPGFQLAHIWRGKVGSSLRGRKLSRRWVPPEGSKIWKKSNRASRTCKCLKSHKTAKGMGSIPWTHGTKIGMRKAHIYGAGPNLFGDLWTCRGHLLFVV